MAFWPDNNVGLACKDIDAKTLGQSNYTNDGRERVDDTPSLIALSKSPVNLHDEQGTKGIHSV